MTILNPILGKEFDNDKLSVLDILAEDEQGRKFNIEMQASVTSELPQRLAFYLTTIYSNQLTEGVGYSSLRQAISICVLTRSMFPDDHQLHLDFRLRSPSGLILTNDLQIHLLELPKLCLTEENVCQATAIERWAYFLRNADRLSWDDVKRIFPDPEIAEAAGVLEMISKSPEEHRLYDLRLKFQRDEVSRIEATQRELEAARAKALHEGRVEGLVEGRVEGRVEGLREGEAKGVQKGVLLGRIALLQELLGISQPTIDEISVLQETELSELAEQLQIQLRNRAPSN